MFRLLKLEPPHGWRAVSWELAIVAIGVIIALGAQQWAEDFSWRDKTRLATAAIGAEVGDHYANAVEWRVVQPCLQEQLVRLQQRLANSGSKLDPAPIYQEEGIGSYVLRLPSRPFNDAAWQAAIADGVTTHLPPEVRKTLGEQYAQVAALDILSDRNDHDVQRIFSLSRPIELDASVKFELMQALDELHGRLNFMDVSSGQVLGNVNRAGMTPGAAVVDHLLKRSGTRKLCIREHLPLRSLKEASMPIDYFYIPKNISSNRS